MKRIVLICIGFFLFSGFIYGEKEEKRTQSEKQIVDSALMEDIFKKVEKLEERVSKLEEEIQNLKEYIEKLEKVVRNLEIYVKPASSLPPSEKDWKRIRRGMSKEKVLEILGDPEEIRKPIGGGEIWYYYRRGSITFDDDGRVRYVEDFKYFPPRY